MKVHVPSRTLLIEENDPRIVELIEKTRVLPTGSTFALAVPHNVANVKELRSLGYEAPSPMATYYNWPGKYKPFEAQRLMTDELSLHKRMFNLSEPGIGKTATALWVADWLMNEGHIKRALIIAPLSTLSKIWMQDIFDVLMHRSAVVVHGTREQRMKALAMDVDFLLLNHDGVKIDDVREYICKDPTINLVIMDEGDDFRNSQTERWKALSKMIRDDMRVIWQTGTPCPTSPTDVWAQCKIVSPHRVPKFFGSFKRMCMNKEGQFKWEVRSDAYVTAYTAMQPAVRLKKSDWLDLPPMMPPRNLEAPLTEEQKKMVKSLIKEFKATLTDEEKEGKEISAVNAADRINKIRQVLCGAVKMPDGSYQSIPHGPRFAELVRGIQQAKAKVIVIVPFKGIIQSLEQELTDAGYTVGVLNGDVSIGKRNAIITAFKSGADPHILLCHPKVMSHGLNLVEADTLIFYAPIYSNSQYLQVIERFNRTGQKNVMNVLRLGGIGIEWDIYDTVDKRAVTQNNVLQLYHSILETKL